MSASNDDDDSLRIFELIDKHAWEDVMELVRIRPEQAKVDSSGRNFGSLMLADGAHANLALHEACKNQPSTKLVDCLLEANPEAVKTKGQWAFLPLHYAVSSGASKEVVQRLLDANPAGTRSRDEHEKLLPIHLACKWGASKDVLLAIMQVYPEGIYVRDTSGKTPREHAESLAMPTAREELLEGLRMGSMFCAVSKAAQLRVSQETESRLRGMAEAHTSHVARWEERRREERNEARQAADQLKTKLHNQASELLSVHHSLENLQHEHSTLTKSKKAVEDVLDSERGDHEKKITELLQNMENQRKDSTDRISQKDDAIAKLESVRDDKISEIGALKEQIAKLEEDKSALENALKEEQAVVKKQAGEIEELSVFPGIVEAREATIEDLYERIEVHEKAEHALATSAVLLQKARNEAQHDLRVALAERDSIRQRKDEVQTDLATAKKHIETYKSRLFMLHGWVKSLSSDMESWTIDSSWPLPKMEHSDKDLPVKPPHTEEKKDEESDYSRALLEETEKIMEMTRKQIEDATNLPVDIGPEEPLIMERGETKIESSKESVAQQ